jgi:hypothetical protein
MARITPARMPILRSSIIISGYCIPDEASGEAVLTAKDGGGTSGWYSFGATDCGAALATTPRLFLPRADCRLWPRLDLPGIYPPVVTSNGLIPVPFYLALGWDSS